MFERVALAAPILEVEARIAWTEKSSATEKFVCSPKMTVLNHATLVTDSAFYVKSARLSAAFEKAAWHVQLDKRALLQKA